MVSFSQWYSNCSCFGNAVETLESFSCLEHGLKARQTFRQKAGKAHKKVAKNIAEEDRLQPSVQLNKHELGRRFGAGHKKQSKVCVRMHTSDGNVTTMKR